MQIETLHPAAFGEGLLTMIAIFSVAFGFAACCLAAWTHVRLVNARGVSEARSQSTEQALALRDALLAAVEERISILDDGTPVNTDGARSLFQIAMDGPDARSLALAVVGLQRGQTAFRLVARGPADEAIAVRGVSVCGRPTLFARTIGSVADTLDFRAALDAIPLPVWLKGPDLRLRWANRCFLAAVEASGLKTAVASNVVLTKSESELFVSVRDGGIGIEARRYAMIEGERRAVSLRLARLPDSNVAGIAIDMTELVRAEARLKLNNDAATHLLDRVTSGIAVFDREQKLFVYNSAYADIWKLSEEWLDTHPTLETILDNLREESLLPERRSFQTWKTEQRGMFGKLKKRSDETWHLPDGRTVQVASFPHLLGGIAFLFEDITEKLQLETSFRLLTLVQRATLDTVGDSIAIFGPDGRLVLHNKEFARQWHLAEDELANQPTLAKISSLATSRLGPDGLWQIVAAGIASDEPERCNEWGKVRRTDGRIIALSMARLPNGATAVTFSDLTEIERFEAAQKETSHSAA
jgi:PAS domain-containing protein